MKTAASLAPKPHGPRRVRRGNQEDAQAVKNALLAAAHHLFQKGGLEAITIRAVTQATGVSMMTPYRYFASKSELLSGLWQSVVGEVVKRQKEAAAQESQPAARLKASIRAYLEYWEAHPQEYRLVYMPAPQAAQTIFKAATNAQAFSEIRVFSRQLTLELARDVGGHESQVDAATNLRHFLVLGFLHSNMVNRRTKPEIARLQPQVIDHAVQSTIHCLMARDTLYGPPL